MEINFEKKAAHCLVLPYPVQGHMNPMIQFAKRLQHKGVKVTLVTTCFISKSLFKDPSTSSIDLEAISDGYDEGGFSQAGSLQAYQESFSRTGPEGLAELVKKMNSNSNGSSSCPVGCIVYDALLPWGLDVAKRFGLVAAAFVTNSCALCSILYHLHNGFLKLPLQGNHILLPGMPPLEPQHIPSFDFNSEKNQALFDISVTDQVSSIQKADWVLCNTFYELEEEVAEWLGKLLPLRTIGPAIPDVEDDKGDSEFSIYKPNSKGCLEWLNDRAKGSVVYVSLGSLAEVTEEQMGELGGALKASDKYFLWVVRESEQAKLPKNFIEETSEKGLVVHWCPQIQVLGHEATGCFITHSGWNSTLEALSLGVPMVAMPQWGDQCTNAKYVVDEWKMGVQVSADEEGIVRRESILHCIKEISESQNGKKLKKNASKWRKAAEEALAGNGSSDKNIHEFVANLMSFKNL